ncbi:MAG: hypothetical protein MHM6MM_005779 [Cercozoa sp. M6MM]
MTKQTATTLVLELLHVFSRSDSEVKERVAAQSVLGTLFALVQESAIMRPLVAAAAGAGSDDNDDDTGKYSSQSDHRLSDHMSDHMGDHVTGLSDDNVATVIKIVTVLAMDSRTHRHLDQCHAAARLTPFLSSQSPVVMQTSAAQTLFYLTQVKAGQAARRVEAIARAGAVPLLQRIIAEQNPLKEFAYPIVCKMPHLGDPRVLQELHKHNGVDFFLELLSHTHWQMHALDALVGWLEKEPLQLRQRLLLPDALDRLVAVFASTSNKASAHNRSVFESIVQSFLKLTAPVAVRTRIAAVLAGMPAFARAVANACLTFVQSPTIVKHSLSLLLQLWKAVGIEFGDGSLQSRRRLRVLTTAARQPVLAMLDTDHLRIIARTIANSLKVNFENFQHDNASADDAAKRDQLLLMAS